MIVFAHIRGGGELGRIWYESGKLLEKKNTFKDFITCAEFLVQTHVTNTQLLVIQGASAGGLLMGAVLNARPDLFKACLTRVPFVDVMATMSDPSIPLTVGEYEEWGNPQEEKYYDYMLSYSPYENVKEQDYPSILITTAINDSRVRHRKTDNNHVLLNCKITQGHGGSSGRYSYLEEQAFILSFVLDQLGIKK